MNNQKKIVYNYCWSLIDRLIIFFGTMALVTMLMLLAIWHQPSGLHRMPTLVLALPALLLLGFILLILIRQAIFSPASTFTRLCKIVSDTYLDSKQLGAWSKWSDTSSIKTVEDLHREATSMLDSIGDFYTCLLSPHEESAKAEGKSLLDFGLSCGIKRTPAGLIILNENGNLLPETDDDGYPRVGNVVFDSPAYQSGLRPGDIILSLGDEECQGCSLARMYNLGKVDRSVAILLKRNNSQLSTSLSLKRAVPACDFRQLKNNVGYLRVESFERISTSKLSSALQRLKTCSKCIIDVRGNRGGDIRHALFLLSAFLEEGVLANSTRRLDSGSTVKLRFRLTESAIRLELEENGSGEYSPVRSNGDLKRSAKVIGEQPVIVLVDSLSMSGAELFAGAMRDFGRARILGEKTFGKGVGQDVFNIPPCVKVSVTSMCFTTPSGRWPGDGAISIANGIEPDESFPVAGGSVYGGPEDLLLSYAQVPTCKPY